MNKEEVISLLENKGFKKISSRNFDAVLPVENSDGCLIYVDVTVKDETIKGQIDGKEVLKYPSDHFDLYVKDKNGNIIASTSSKDLSILSEKIGEFKNKALDLFPAPGFDNNK